MLTLNRYATTLLLLMFVIWLGCSRSEVDESSDVNETSSEPGEANDGDSDKLSALDFTIGHWREYSQQVFPEESERIETGSWECKREGDRLVSHLDRDGETTILHFYYDASIGKLVSETVGQPEYTMQGTANPESKSVTFKMMLDGERHVFETMPVGEKTISTLKILSADGELVREWRVENEPF